MWQSYGSGEASPPKPISVSGIVRELIKGLGSIATQNGVALTTEISEDKCTLLGDSVQITRAIQNVIVNAIQAAAEIKGAVSVSCERKEFYVDVRVHDAGPGMQAEQLQRIFEPYFTTISAELRLHPRPGVMHADIDVEFPALAPDTDGPLCLPRCLDCIDDHVLDRTRDLHRIAQQRTTVLRDLGREWDAVLRCDRDI